MALVQQHHKPTIAVSACLLGQPVRFDGGHKKNRFVADQLSRLIDIIPFCPEMEAGLGTPRPAIQLRRIGEEIRLVQSKNATVDLTEKVAEVSVKRARQLASRVCGLVVQKKSPTCGMERVPVSYGVDRPALREGVGIFVQHFQIIAPLVPIEEEGRLNDPILRENFLERVYALDRWSRLDPEDLSGFIEFHAHHKLQLMARGSEAYMRLGRIVAGVTRQSLSQKRQSYIAEFMQTLRSKANRGRHCNVLQHMMGYLKNDLSSDDKKELLQLLDAYKEGQVPLATPIMMMRHHLRNYPDVYLQKQHYLTPYPDDLALRAVV